MLSGGDALEAVGGRNDGDALVAAERTQVAIARDDDIRIGDDAHRELLAAARSALGACRINLGLDLLFAHRRELHRLDLVECAK